MANFSRNKYIELKNITSSKSQPGQPTIVNVIDGIGTVTLQTPHLESQESGLTEKTEKLHKFLPTKGFVQTVSVANSFGEEKLLVGNSGEQFSLVIPPQVSCSEKQTTDGTLFCFSGPRGILTLL